MAARTAALGKSARVPGGSFRALMEELKAPATPPPRPDPPAPSARKIPVKPQRRPTKQTIFGQMHRFEPPENTVRLINQLEVARDAQRPVHHGDHAAGELNTRLWNHGRNQTPWLQYFRSAARGQFPPATTQPEACVLGHSNVGKSLLLNVLAQSTVVPAKDRAGVTGNVHFYRLGRRPGLGLGVAGGGMLVDTPGYGFAQTTEARKAEWRAVVRAYLHDRAAARPARHVAGAVPSGLRRAFVVVSATHGLRQLDVEQLDELEALRIPFTIVLTQCDLISITMLAQRATVIDQLLERYRLADGVSLRAGADDPAALRCLLVSSVTEAGVGEVRRALAHALGPVAAPAAIVRNTQPKSSATLTRGFASDWPKKSRTTHKI